LIFWAKTGGLSTALDAFPYVCYTFPIISIMAIHTVYNCLRTLRQEKRITQEQLAKIVGVSRQTICSMEKGDYVPSLSLALLIAQHFNHPVEHVFQLKKICD
jgi:putative transcriptional regulator